MLGSTRIALGVEARLPAASSVGLRRTAVKRPFSLIIVSQLLSVVREAARRRIGQEVDARPARKRARSLQPDRAVLGVTNHEVAVGGYSARSHVVALRFRCARIMSTVSANAKAL